MCVHESLSNSIDGVIGFQELYEWLQYQTHHHSQNMKHELCQYKRVEHPPTPSYMAGKDAEMGSQTD